MRTTKVRLVAYSIIHVAPPTYQTPYGVGMVEDEKGERSLVRIKRDYINVLKTGLEGEIRKEPAETEELDFFYPQ